MRKFIILLLINLFAQGVVANSQNIQENTQDDKEFNYSYSNGCNQVYDPYEKFNRKVFIFNSVLDYLILRPVTIGYKKITNDYTKARVSSFLDNINTPLTVVNYGLQGSYDKFMKGFWRFLINSTFGIGGLFDVASKVELQIVKQTFGSTLASYGVGPGPYLVVPFIGGANARDITDSMFTNNYFNPIMHVAHRDFKIIVMGSEIVDTRLALLPFTDYVAHNSIDPYIAIRSATHQNRESMVSYPKRFNCPKSTNNGR
jgi:phospholipid-binding lipoprotein MlaA